MDSNLLKLLIPVAVCHALGHVTSNVSFAAVAVSFTHTIKGDVMNLFPCSYIYLVECDFVYAFDILSTGQLTAINQAH